MHSDPSFVRERKAYEAKASKEGAQIGHYHTGREAERVSRVLRTGSRS